jgi:Peptidase family M48
VDANRRSDPRGLYGLQVTVAGAGLAGCALGLAAGVSRVHVAPAAAQRLNVGGARFTYPAANAAAVALIALAALGVAVLFVSLRGAWRQGRAHRRLVHALPVAGSLPSHPAVCVVDVAAPLAFCAGWLHPRIYLSTATLSLLSESELRAVLAHEHHHRARRDPLRLAVGRVLSQALFFLPVLRPLHERYGDVAELTADAAALEATGGAPGAARHRHARHRRHHSGRSRGHLARASGRVTRPAADLAPALAAAHGRDDHDRRARRARLARGRQRVRADQPQPSDRLVAALPAGPGSRPDPGLLAGAVLRGSALELSD